MSKFLKFLALYAALVVGILLLAGCASAPATLTAQLPILLPCPSAQSIPDEPPRFLTLDATRPGEAIKAYAANRALWIGYGDALAVQLKACQ
jgi:uncharacterized lipoprotein YajG